MSDMVVPIHGETIRLGQLLKLANLVPDGASARLVIEQGEVLVDEVVETRRGRQLQADQQVRWGAQLVVISGPA